jgi:UDP-N-acetylglucosamine diphosphorylase/glucosamine-1-phosphate N-acetyltransferase
MTENLVITILAGGQGKRMKSDLPKVLHLFQNKPMLVRIVETALQLIPKKIIIITGENHQLIVNTLEDYIDIKSSILEFVIQKTPLGTGDAIRCCLSSYDKNDKVIILNGDMPLINDKVLKKFIYECNNSEINILVAKLSKPFGYGRIIYNSEGELSQIIEEKDCNETQRKISIVNSGIYYITSQLLQLYIPFIENNNGQKEYYLTDIVKIIKNNSDISIKTYLIEESDNNLIRGVNTIEELFKLEMSI